MESTDIIFKGKGYLDLEAKAIEATRERLDASFAETIRLIETCFNQRNKLVFSGVGKNEPICEKIRATFNSTGVTAVYLDPLKALHGDLGLCDSGDLAFLFSNSGESEELIVLNSFLKRLNVTTVAFTSKPESQLAQKTDFKLVYHYEEEACPLSLAPTASTTAALALGDALAMVFLELRGLGREDFAKYHPSGNLGRSLLLKVDEIMRTGERMAVLPDDRVIRDAILAITQARCGTIALVDPQSGILTGVFSDGDFRRASLRETDVLNTPVQRYMSRNPKKISSNQLAIEALRIFQNHRINDLIVVDSAGAPIGLIDGQDLPGIQLV